MYHIVKSATILNQEKSEKTSFYSLLHKGFYFIVSFMELCPESYFDARINFASDGGVRVNFPIFK